jgi:hypothetical protein
VRFRADGVPCGGWPSNEKTGARSLQIPHVRREPPYLRSRQAQYHFPADRGRCTQEMRPTTRLPLSGKTVERNRQRDGVR